MEFISQRGRPHADYACGVASLMMLLKHHNVDDGISYQELARALRITTSVIKKWDDQYQDAGNGAYPADITKYLKDKGVSFIQIHDASNLQVAKDILLSLIDKGPVMVGMDWGDEGHWIVITRIINNNYEYFDPYKKINEKYCYLINQTELLIQWDGFAIQVVS